MMIGFLIVVVLSLNSVSLIAATCAQTSYAAPYDLSAGPAQLSAHSSVGGDYYITPCNSMASCEDAPGWEICYHSSGSGDVGLGKASTAAWSAYQGDWTNGATSVNTDMDDDYWQCEKTLGGSVTVNYRCLSANGTDTLTATTEPASTSSKCTFVFDVDSSIVCAYQKANSGGGSDGGGGSSKSGLSGGWIFVIVLIVATFVYLTGGMAFNRYRKGMSGVEMIPNLSFWRELPGLVKDGCYFTYIKLKSCASGRGGAGLAGTSTTGSYETI